MTARVSDSGAEKSAERLTRAQRVALAALIALLASAALLALRFPPAAAGVLQPSELAALLAAASVPYGYLLATRAQLKQKQLLTLVAALGLLFVFCDPPLSDDIFRYLWDGKVLLSGTDPYAHAPSSAALAELRGPLWERVNHPTIPTIYPPLSQLLFAAADLLWHHPMSFKVFALAAHLGVTCLLKQHAGNAPALAYGLNPLAITETALNGHLDVFCGGALLLCALAASPLRAIFWALCAGFLKLIGFLVLPLLLIRLRVSVRHVGVALLSLASVAACLLLLSQAGYGDRQDQGQVEALSHYSQRWEGNSAVYHHLEAGVQHLISQPEDTFLGLRLVESDTSEDPQVGFPFPEALALMEGTSLDPWRPLIREKKAIFSREEMSASMLASWFTRLAVLALIGVLALVFLRRPRALGMRHLLLAALLLVPQMHPWYLLWLLPLDAMLRRHAAFVWSACVWVAYAPLDAWLTARVWQSAPDLVNFEFALVLLAVALEAWSNRRDPSAQMPPQAAPADQV